MATQSAVELKVNSLYDMYSRFWGTMRPDQKERFRARKASLQAEVDQNEDLAPQTITQIQTTLSKVKIG